MCFGATTAPQQALFRADNVQYIIKPVSGFREMLLATQAIVGADEFDVSFFGTQHPTDAPHHTSRLPPQQRVHHIVHLGCGSSYDLEAEIPVPAGVTRIVIDSHMPVHHNNVHSNNVSHPPSAAPPASVVVTLASAPPPDHCCA